MIRSLLSGLENGAWIDGYDNKSNERENYSSLLQKTSPNFFNEM